MVYEIPADGWIRLWRRLLNKKAWIQSKPKQKVVLTTLLLMVDFEPKEAEWNGKKITLKPGSMITSLEDIREAAGIEISIQNIRTALDNFENKFEFLKQKTTATGRFITILNWREYQQNGFTNEESLARVEDAEKLYGYYMDKISPKHAANSKKLALSNIIKHSKKNSFKDMAMAIKNYSPTALGYDPEFRKKPSNFFGVNEPFFKDFLPGKFKAGGDKPAGRTLPERLTAERLQELNA